MEFANRLPRGILAVLAIACTATLVWFGNGLDPWWPLMWFAPLPVLWFARRNSWGSAAIVATLALLVGSLNLWGYFHLLGTPFVVWLVTFSMAALVFATAVLLFRALVLKGAWWSALVGFSATGVSLEYVRSLVSIHGTSGSVAYSQLHFLPFLQLASITGIWGMGFLLSLFPAAIAVGIHLRSSRPKDATRVLIVSFGVIALVLVFGAIRLATPHSATTVRVGLIASDSVGNLDVTAPGADTSRLLTSYAGEAEQLAARGAAVIVIPEKLGVVTDATSQQTDAIFQRLSDKAGPVVVAGQLHVSAPLKYNRAQVYASGSPVVSYDKQHMLPPFESNLKPGTRLVTMPMHGETWGVAICKDMDFTGLSRQYGEAGAGLMLVPAWDFGRDRIWHGHMAVMRGVEDGFSIVRAAKDGYLTVSDDRGRIVAETRSDSAPFATLIANVPATHDNTLYLKFGDWFAWLSVGLLLFSIVRLFLPVAPAAVRAGNAPSMEISSPVSGDHRAALLIDENGSSVLGR